MKKKLLSVIRYFIPALLLFPSQLLFSQWVNASIGLPNSTVNSVASIGTVLFAGTSGNGVYKSIDTAGHWTAVNNGLSNPNINALITNGAILYAATLGSGIFTSSNNGANWIQSGLSTGSFNAFASIGTTIFAGGGGSGVFSTSDNGVSWVPAGLSGKVINSFCTSGSTLYAGTYGNGVYYTTNNGALWTQANSGITNLYIFSLTSSGNRIFAGTFGGGVFASTNSGNSWTAINNGLSNLNIKCLIAFQNYLMAASAGGGFSIYRFTSQNSVTGMDWYYENDGIDDYFDDFLYYVDFITEIILYITEDNGKILERNVNNIIGIEPVSSEVPQKFYLSQNYPNPFNPATNISIAIPKTGFVKLVVYDALGREIETLVNLQLNAGTYKVDWNAAKYSSGVYFYKLVSDKFNETKKMILVK